MESANEQPIEVKIAVMGGGGIGKTAMCIQFIQKVFIQEYDPTIEDTFRKQITLDNKTYVVNILDTAGMEEFSSMRDHYMRQAEGFLLCFAITSRSSYDELSSFREQILRVRDVDYIPMIVVGTKADLLHERQLLTSEVVDLCKSWNVPMIEISAANYNEVEAAFLQIVSDILKFRNRKEPQVNRRSDGKGSAIPPSTFKSEMELLSKDEDVKNFTFFLEKESKMVKIHKEFFASASPVLKQLLSTSTSASISDLSEEALRIISSILITQNSPNAIPKPIVEEMTKFAEKFQALELAKVLHSSEEHRVYQEEICSLVSQIEDLVLQVFHEDKNFYALVSAFRKNYVQILVCAAELVHKLLSYYHLLDDSRKNYIAQFIAKKIEHVLKTFLLTSASYKQLHEGKLKEMIVTETSDFFVEKLTLLVLKRTEDAGNRYTSRSERLNVARKQTEDGESKFLMKAAVKSFAQTIQNNFQYLEQMEHYSQNVDDFIDLLLESESALENSKKYLFSELSNPEFISEHLGKMWKKWERVYTKKQKSLEWFIDLIDDQHLTKVLRSVGELKSPAEQEQEPLKLPFALNDKSVSDFTFIVEEKPIYVSKSVLAFRCVELRSWLEKSDSELKISEYSYSAFYLFLQYLYTDLLEISKETPKEIVKEILTVAHRLQVQRLKAICQVDLIERFDFKEAQETFELSEKYDCSILQQGLINYLLDNSTRYDVSALPKRLTEKLEISSKLREQQLFSAKMNYYPPDSRFK